jgi:hypothetical protein
MTSKFLCFFQCGWFRTESSKWGWCNDDKEGHPKGNPIVLSSLESIRHGQRQAELGIAVDEKAPRSVKRRAQAPGRPLTVRVTPTTVCTLCLVVG